MPGTRRKGGCRARSDRVGAGNGSVALSVVTVRSVS